MKALSLIAIVFAAFLVFLGFSSREASGRVLGNAIIVGGVLIFISVLIIWAIILIKEKKGK